MLSLDILAAHYPPWLHHCFSVDFYSTIAPTTEKLVSRSTGPVVRVLVAQTLTDCDSASLQLRLLVQVDLYLVHLQNWGIQVEENGRWLSF